MKRSILLLLPLMIISTLLLSCCSLAVPAAQALPQRDRLIGFYVTEQYVDNINWEETVLSSQGQLEAPINQAVEGELDLEREQVSFGDIAGYPFIYALFDQAVPMSDEPQPVWSGVRTDNFYDLKLHSSDAGEAITVSLPFDASRVGPDCHLAVYANAVYQRQDGSVYMQPGQGLMVDHPGQCSLSFSEKLTSDVAGQVEQQEISYQLVMEPQQPALAVILTQTADDGRVLQRDEFAAAQLPPSYQRLADTAYILVELKQADGVKRWDIISNDQNYYYVFAADAGLILSYSSIELQTAGQ